MAADLLSPGIVRIGLVADAHYAERPPAIGRWHRKSLPRMIRAVEALDREGVGMAVQLGDLINGLDAADDERNLATMAEILGGLGTPWLHVLGNHDLDWLSKRAFLNVCGQAESFCAMNHAGLRLIVLDACHRRDGVSYGVGPFEWTDTEVPPAQQEWLRGELAGASGKCIVFVHQRLDVAAGDPYGVHSRTAIRRVMEESGKVAAVVQGHYHRGAHVLINSIPYITLPAMVEGETQNSYGILEVNPATGAVRLQGFERAARVPTR